MRQEAETTVEAASATVDESMQRAREALESTASAAFHQWHRNWMVSKQQELRVSHAALAKTRGAEQLARQRAQTARRDLRVLERWFDRVWRRYQEEQRRSETRELDAVGAIQYAARLRTRGGG